MGLIVGLIVRILEWAASNPSTAAQIVTSIVIATFAAVAWHESRRQALIAYIIHSLEGLYNPLFTAIEKSGGDIFAPLDVGEGPYQPWLDEILPLFSRYRYLATPRLRFYYSILLKDEKARTEWTPKFVKQVNEDYEYQIHKLEDLTGARSRVVKPLLWLFFAPVRMLTYWMETRQPRKEKRK